MPCAAMLCVGGHCLLHGTAQADYCLVCCLLDRSPAWDIGWHKQVDLTENPDTHRLEVVRPLLPGSYPFKFVVDGTWCINADYPHTRDGSNTNNIITVLPKDAKDSALRERLLSPTGDQLLLLDHSPACLANFPFP